MNSWPQVGRLVPHLTNGVCIASERGSNAAMNAVFQDVLALSPAEKASVASYANPIV